MTLNELCQAAYNASKDKGWYDGRIRHPLEMHMLIVSEVAEATESVRSQQPAVWVPDYNGIPIPIDPRNIKKDLDALDASNGIPKPEGEAIELADALIRIADLFGARGWDLDAAVKAKMAYNATRPYRHGGKAI